MKKEKLNSLIDRYLDGTASSADIPIVESFYQSFDLNPGYTNLLTNMELESKIEKGFTELWYSLSLTGNHHNW